MTESRTPEAYDTLVVGAGIAGLECARGLVGAGRRVLVVDRARGVGGRCATRRFDEQPVDFGPLFLHGRDPSFLAAAQGVPGVRVLTGWPRHVEGRGAACQPDAFDPGETRFAFAEGLSALPRHLATGLTVRLSSPVQRLTVEARTVQVHLESGEILEARDVVCALALEQTQGLLAPLPETPALVGTRALLSLFATVPSLALIAGYRLDAPAPPWDVLYPEDSACLQLIGHDSAKRESPGARVLVLQARPRWSRERLEAPTEAWAAELLAEASARLGTWVAQPRFTHPHRWRFARLERGDELAQPVCIRFGGGQRIGLAGELFAPGGGVEAAWLSGRRLAQRLLEEAA